MENVSGNWGGGNNSTSSTSTLTSGSGGGGVAGGGNSTSVAATVPLKKDDLDDSEGNDAEGVWSADIEQSFHESLAIYPPCGRRKIILSDEGKMYGRNELIARYIKLRTGKNRTRKQVSSHIQVLARRKSKELQNQIKDPATKEKCLHQLSQLSSAQIVSASVMPQRGNGGPTTTGSGGQAIIPGSIAGTGYAPTVVNSAPPGSTTVVAAGYWPSTGSAAWGSHLPDVAIPPWTGRSIAGPKLRLVELLAFMEKRRADVQTEQYQSGMRHIFAHIGPTSYTYSDPLLEQVDVTQIWDKFPEKHGLKEFYERGPPGAFFLVKFWADINTAIPSDALYAVTLNFEGTEGVPVRLSTKVCSFGKQVVEKIEEETPKFENGQYVYRFERSPMCDYMKSFIFKLLQLPQKPMMNSVLENFTILQVVSNRDTGETLLCIAYVFEVSQNDHGAQHHTYRLTR